VYITALDENVKHEAEALVHTSQIACMTYGGNAQILLAAGNMYADITGHVLVWDTVTAKSISFPAQDGRVTEVCYTTVLSKSGESIGILVTLSTTGQVKCWNVTPVIHTVTEAGYESGMVIENVEELLVFSTDLECRCSALAVTSDS
jgi:WD40 repeat protein